MLEGRIWRLGLLFARRRKLETTGRRIDVADEGFAPSSERLAGHRLLRLLSQPIAQHYGELEADNLTVYLEMRSLPTSIFVKCFLMRGQTLLEYPRANQAYA